MESLYFVDKTDPINRCIKAAKPIPKEKLILKSTPLVLAPVSHNKQNYCNFCFVPKSPLLKCGGCGSVFYCSQECQKEDWFIHKHECKILKQILENKYIYLVILHQVDSLFCFLKND